MKVKIGNTIYDPEQQPVMVLLTPKDKANIANMPPKATRYACFHEKSDPEAIKRWMVK